MFKEIAGEKIKILVADAHELVRNGLRKVLDDQPDMVVVDEAVDGIETIQKLRLKRPDVVLVDMKLPFINGLETTKLIKKASIGTRVVILSMHRKDAYVYQAIVSGALGYVLKPSLTPNLISAVRAVYNGKYFLSPKINSEFIREILQFRGAGFVGPASSRPCSPDEL